MEKYEEEFKLGLKLIRCPVCGADTLDMYSICPKCDWEYDGERDENKYSSANQSTIQEYRKNLKIALDK